MNQPTNKFRLTVDEKIAVLAKDISELARSINTQAALLEAIVFANEDVRNKYIELIKTVRPVNEDPKK